MPELETRACDVAGFETLWVRFKPGGYSFKLQRELDAVRVNGAEATMARILDFVEAWNLTDINGAEVYLPPPGPERGLPVLDNVDEALIPWLIREFYAFRADRMTAKNSLPPQPSTP